MAGGFFGAGLADLYIARNDYAQAQALMEKAVVRFENSPVLLPKRIEVLRGVGRQADAQALVLQYRKYGIDELTKPAEKRPGRAEAVQAIMSGSKASSTRVIWSLS